MFNIIKESLLQISETEIFETVDQKNNPSMETVSRHIWVNLLKYGKEETIWKFKKKNNY
jgi:hypothetical protein